jgi:hypothetical protein
MMFAVSAQEPAAPGIPGTQGPGGAASGPNVICDQMRRRLDFERAGRFPPQKFDPHLKKLAFMILSWKVCRSGPGSIPPDAV